MESHSANVRRLVDEFRGRSGDARIDVGGLRRVWESLLRQVEADAASHLDLAAVLQQQLSRPTIEASFHRKLQSRKVFAHREAYEQVVSKTEEKLQRARLDYKRAYATLLTSEAGSGAEQELKRAYLESHNAYILQLRATNAITERYQLHCLPGLLGEIAEVYEELCGLACKCISGISEAASERSGEQSKRYQAVAKEAQSVVPTNDLQALARNLSANATPRKPPRRLYVAPAPPEQVPMERINQIPTLRDELVPTGTSTLPLMEDLKHEHDSLTQEIGRQQDALDTLVRMQRKSAESNLYTKVAELQEDISLKRFDLGVAQLRLAAVQAQKELFGGGEAGQPDGMASRKMSNGSTGSPKLKWLKAFKSLKTSTPTTPPLSDKKSLESEGGHTWREYTYRKITPCDACGQVLRGHSRQGVRCRGCKANAHTDCINMIQPALCPSLAPKKSGGIPLLRRQKTQVASDEVPTSSEHSEYENQMQEGFEHPHRSAASPLSSHLFFAASDNQRQPALRKHLLGE
ncbi:SH3 and cysteine-rich domain-containing protein [Ooceraea biroi]|uniref:SH3 and cysteine-rich domain-containing protein n=1 Tax=Ooceraea biroi TaxID=2015173 RepID=A0A026W2E6_OOCBI|nr:SH3 and cysteine-rich domain-containing protein [Ooceraea biroi]